MSYIITWEEFSDDGKYHPELIEPEVLQKIDAGDWLRAGGGVVCTTCNKTYSDHRRIVGASFLTKLCDNRLVKL